MSLNIGKKKTGLEIMKLNYKKIQHVSKLIELLKEDLHCLQNLLESRHVGRMFILVNPKHKD